MSDAELLDALEQYRAGLEAEIALLRQLHTVASRQREGTAARDFEQFGAESDARDRLTRCLVNIEQGLRVIRDSLIRGRADLVNLPAYQEVMALRQTAADVVASILATDKDSMKALADAELARRAAVSSLERGETTLAAYRKVIAPPVSGASLVDRRG
jgi:D-alanine-D-alanine ligase-like ATP-grasp enzyme